MSGGTAEDYCNHVTHTIDNLAHTYCDIQNSEYDATRVTMIGNIFDCLTDRAVVNHAAIQKISSYWDKPLNEVKCHLHPLDTVASSCQKTLKSMQPKEIKMALFGNLALKIILGVNKMQLKDSKVDPQGFKMFLKSKSLPLGLFPRFRGNRLHILFHTAGIIIQHYSLLQEYLSTGLVKCGGLRAALLADLMLPEAFDQLCVSTSPVHLYDDIRASD